MTIDNALNAIRSELEKDLKSCSTTKELEVLHVKYLGKKGKIQALMPALRDCIPEERPAFGKAVNELKTAITHSLDELQAQFKQAELNERLAHETIDVTLPGERSHLGRKHVIQSMLDEALDILIGMGFSVQYGPDVDTEYYNFEGLNFGKDHPARDMQDTFYITPEILLRTHTSNTQVRVMEATPPPIRIAAPGKCYRNEDISARSHVLFHQIEGLYIDKDVTFADLLSTMEEFYAKFMKQEVAMRYRPSYFPFVEPGMEVDIHCICCEGKGCSICKHTGWLEVAGAGLVHPEVLKSGGIDPEKFSGYAWGMGLERLAMLRYGIKDIRLFMENGLRFLSQF